MQLSLGSRSLPRRSAHPFPYSISSPKDCDYGQQSDRNPIFRLSANPPLAIISSLSPLRHAPEKDETCFHYCFTFLSKFTLTCRRHRQQTATDVSGSPGPDDKAQSIPVGVQSSLMPVIIGRNVVQRTSKAYVAFLTK